MFESITTMLNDITVMGMGAFIFVLALMFAIARGITKNTQDLILYFIIIGSFGTVLMFSEDYIKTSLFLVTAVAIVIFGFVYLKRRYSEE